MTLPSDVQEDLESAGARGRIDIADAIGAPLTASRVPTPHLQAIRSTCCADSLVAVTVMPISGPAVVGNEVDHLHFGGHRTQQGPQMAFDPADVSIELAEMQDFQEAGRP